MIFARIGAISYVIWGLLHIKAAYDEFLLAAGLSPGLVQGKLNQGSWDLLFIAVVAIIIAVLLNWKNNIQGFWINLVMVSIADIGFIIFVLIPGHVELFPGILGPVFWLGGAVFSAIGIRSEKS